MIIKFNQDGSFNSIVGSNVFQSSSGANIIEMQIDKPQDSNVSINLLRADNVLLIPKPCNAKIGEETSAWTYVFGTMGSPDLVVDGFLEISFTIEKGGVALNTETYIATVQLSHRGDYTPVDPETAEILQEQINALKIDKVDRVDATNVPAHFQYSQDGFKTPNVLYYNFTSDVRELDDTIVEKTGGVLVLRHSNNQVELFITTSGSLYKRTIIGGVISDFTLLSKDEFANYYTKEEADDIFATIEDYYSKVEADERFAILTGNQEFTGENTFTKPVKVQSAVEETEAINKGQLEDYAYSKAEADEKFEIKATFSVLW